MSGNGRDLPARRARARASSVRVGPVAIPNGALRQPPALHLPRILPAGLQGQRQGQPADHPHPRRPGARRRDPRGQPRQPGPGRRRTGTGHRRQLPARRARAPATRPRGGRRRVLASKPRGCCCCRPPAASRTGWATTTTSRPVPDGAGRPQIAGRFDERDPHVQGAAAGGQQRTVLRNRPARKPYRRGLSIQTVSPLPITWAEHVIAQGHWGEPMREYMRDYIHWATLGALCELLPQPDNRVTLADETDRHGLPVAHFAYTQCANDRRRHRRAQAASWSDMLGRRRRAGRVITIDRYAHLVGGARMARRARRRGHRRRPPGLRRPEPVRRRRQRDAHPGRRQPGTDDHGAGRAAAASGCRAMTLDATAYTGAHRRARGRRHASRGTPRPLVIVQAVHAGGGEGLGWTYSTGAAAAGRSRDTLAAAIIGRDALDIGGALEAMAPRLRNMGTARAWSMQADQRRRHRAVGPQGPAAGPTADARCSGAAATRCRSTAQAASRTLHRRASCADQVARLGRQTACGP